MSTPGLASGSQEIKQTVDTLLKRIDSINFDMISNELNYEEFTILRDAYQNLKYSEVKVLRHLWSKSFNNFNIKGALEHRD